MPESVVVQPVVVEEPGVLHDLQRPLVGDDAVVSLRDRPHVFVVDRDLAAERAEHRREGGVDAREEHDGRTGGGQSCDGILQLRRDVIGIGAGTDDVVAARGDRDQVRLEGDGRFDLVRDDLCDQLAADGEVRVGEVVDLLREHLCDAVRPAAMAVGERGIGVADALGEGVADRDEPPPGVRPLVLDERGAGGFVVSHGILLRQSGRPRRERR